MNSFWSLVLLLALVVTGCTPPTTPGVSTDPTGVAPSSEAATPLAAAAVDAHWGYEGEIGPANWATLDSDYEVCASGTLQSPISLPGQVQPTLADVSVDYKESAITIHHNGHTVQVGYEAGSHMQIGENRYELKQIHFHTPSEHAVDEQRYPIEMHLVHQDSAGSYAVIGVFIQVGDENPAFAPAWDHLPAAETAAPAPTGTRLNAANWLPTKRTLYRYEGSLTTPRCTQGVVWSVMDTPVTMSPAQLAALKALFPNNNSRPLQAIADHDVKLSDGAAGSADDAVPVQSAQCSTEGMTAPVSGGEVMLRFLNTSDTLVSVLWRSDGELISYANLAAGESFDQESYVGHEWVLADPAGNTLLEYSATGDIVQCVLIAQP